MKNLSSADIMFKLDLSRGTVMPDKKLKYLSELNETEFPFISLYLNVNSKMFLEQKEKNRIFIKNNFYKTEKKLRESGEKDKLASFHKDIEKIMYFLENNLNTEAHGVAFFACDKAGIFEVFYSIMPFINSFSINSIPHLKQLAYHFDECENGLVVLTDTQSSRLFSVKLGGFILGELDIKNAHHRFHKQGGWAQMRYQRHIENQALHHFKEVAKVTAGLIDANNFENLILAGQRHDIINLEKFLPERVKSKIIRLTSLDLKENINCILEKIMSELSENEIKKEENAVKDVINSSPVRSTLGLQDTIRLIEDGRADTIIIPGYKSYQGWKCNGCLYVSKEQCYSGCPESYKNSYNKTDLIEEIIRLGIRYNGKLELVKGKPAEELEKFEGIGAIVRY